MTRCAGSTVEFEDRHIGHVVDVGQSGNVGHHGAPTDVEEDPVGRDQFVVDPQRVRVFETGVAADQGAAVHAVQPRLDAGAVVEHDPVLACLDLRHVDGHRTGADAVVGTAAGEVRRVRAGDQGLGRDAPGVDAGSANVLALQHRNGVTGVGQPARPAADRPGRRRRRSRRTVASQHAREVGDQEAATDRDHVLKQRDRQIAPASRGHQALSRLVPAERAEHRADDARPERGEGVMPRRTENRTCEGAGDQPRGELWRRLATRGLG